MNPSETCRTLLIQRGTELLAGPFKPVQFTHNDEADKLLNDLEHHPHAFVLACLMDRQTKAERCWLVPYEFGQRVASVELAAWAALSEAKVLSVFKQRPALHRLVDTMAGIFHLGIRKIVEDYGGDASRIWQGNPTSAALVRRFREFKGAGPKIASMAANILVREMKVPVADKASIDTSADVHVCRVFERLGLVRVKPTTDDVILAAREMNPEYPGVFDLAAWEIGRGWCHPTKPMCEGCLMHGTCPAATG
jgi:endonuclease-3